MSYEIIDHDFGVHIKFSGTYDSQTIREAANEIINNFERNNLHYVIWDVNNISKLGTKGKRANLIASQLVLISTHYPKLKIAIFDKDEKTKNDSNNLIFQVEIQKTGWEFKLFKDMQSIRAWLFS